MHGLWSTTMAWLCLVGLACAGPVEAAQGGGSTSHRSDDFDTVRLPGRAAAGSVSTLSPSEGALLQATHVLFTFEPIPAAVGYRLQVVVDDGQADPFVNPRVVDVELRRPRRIVKEGLQFGYDYAWRMRGLDDTGQQGQWQPPHRFSIAELPGFLVDVITINANRPQSYQPGLNLLALKPPGGSNALRYPSAVDQEGRIVWFMIPTLVTDLRMLRNGNILYADRDGVHETKLDGTDVWSYTGGSVDPHSVFEMPNGNVMVMVNREQQVERDGNLQIWRGCVLTELTREGVTEWTWNAFDHLSSLDFDECVMETPNAQGVYDWLHANAAVYDAVESAVYFSPRHLSRIVKIDYATGDVIWNLGFDMPSGEVAFGDDLFSFQHSPEILPNGNILLYDNGNRRGHTTCDAGVPSSAAVELSVNPASPEPVTVVWQYFQGFYSSSTGDADRLPNGNTLVTAGAGGRVFEVAPDGTVVWELISNSAKLYQTDRIASLYPLRGDTDGDDDLDMRDLASFQRCYRGPGEAAVHRSCFVHDHNEDGAIDVDDLSAFVAAMVGP